VIRVLIAAASPVARAGLEALLHGAPNIEVIGSVAGWNQLWREEADIAVVDWDRGGEDLPPELADAPPASAVVLLVSDPQLAWVADALRAGVRAVLPRESGAGQLIAAINAAAAGLVVLEAEDLNSLLVTPRAPRTAERLSAREMEVLEMLAEGHSNKTIAYRMGISEHTVKFHVTSILAKLGAGSRTEAVTLGIRQGLILL
jgi:NarL family two-component system response regulator YdfI